MKKQQPEKVEVSALSCGYYSELGEVYLSVKVQLPDRVRQEHGTRRMFSRECRVEGEKGRLEMELLRSRLEEGLDALNYLAQSGSCGYARDLPEEKHQEEILRAVVADISTGLLG